MSTGTIDIMAEATPVDVYLIDKREKVTPRNGPKKAPTETLLSAFTFLNAAFNESHRLNKKKINAKPTIPVITLI